MKLKEFVQELELNKATKKIITVTDQDEYDLKFAEHICDLVCKMGNPKTFLKDFIDFSEDFLRLQVKLETKKKYEMETFDQAYKEVYDNDLFMQKYLNGLLLTQIFWLNHMKIFSFFFKNFCDGNAGGDIMEVPIGTGIYLSEFLKKNPSWRGTGYDISKTAVKFSKRLFEKNETRARLEVKDVFEIKNEKYDKIICGELMEHLETPEDLLSKLDELLKDDGEIFLTAAIWAANKDHIYLFKNEEELDTMISKYFKIKNKIVLDVYDRKEYSKDAECFPQNYAVILKKLKLSELNTVKPKEYNYEDLSEGMTFEFNRTLTTKDLNSFAELTGDYNPLHRDANYAKQKGFNDVVIHGMLSSSLFSTLVGMICPGKKNLYLSQSLNFKNPVYPNMELTIRGRIIKKIDGLKLVMIKTEIISRGDIMVYGEAQVKIME